MREASSVRLSAFCKVRLRREAQKGLCVVEAVSVPPAIQHHQLPHHLRVLQQLQRHVSHLATAGAGYIHGRRAMGRVLEMREGSASDMHGGAEAEGMTSHVPQPRPRLARLIEHVHQLGLGHRHACSHRGKAGPHRLSSGPLRAKPRPTLGCSLVGARCVAHPPLRRRARGGAAASCTWAASPLDMSAARPPPRSRGAPR